jgi:TatD DNase family protein
VEFVDSHCHLDDKRFDGVRAAVIERARVAGLKHLLAIGTGDGPPDLAVAIRLAEAYPFIQATVGVHPNDAEKADPHIFKNLETLLGHPKVRAIGEIGLDYHWGVPKHIQLSVFRAQMEMAAGAKMPIVIHTRDAWDDTVAALRETWAPTGLPCILHCFTGDAERARECLDLGFTLGFGGVATFPKSSGIREAARIAPLNRLLIETDAPYLAPVPNRGKRNEPAFVVDTARLLAHVRGDSLESLATQTTANFESIFGLSCQTSGIGSAVSSGPLEESGPRV